jgi:hypothetical protein
MLIFLCRDLSRVVANFLHHQGLVKQAAKAKRLPGFTGV